MQLRQRRRDTLLFLVALGTVGLLTFIFAGSPYIDGPLSAAGARRALLNTASMGMGTVLRPGLGRRQWRRTFIGLSVGAAVLCWSTRAPDRLLQPSWNVLIILIHSGVPLLVAGQVWRRVRRQGGVALRPCQDRRACPSPGRPAGYWDAAKGACATRGEGRRWHPVRPDPPVITTADRVGGGWAWR